MASQPTPDYRQDLLRLVATIAPRRLLCLGEGCAELFAPYLQAHPEASLDTLAPGQLPEAAAHYDFCFVHHTLERLPRGEGEHLLARLRDLHGGRFALLVPLEAPCVRPSCWEENDLLAFGMQRLGRYGQGGERLGLYGFDLATYKPTPDWLNPRFWANPEQWDKSWW